MKMDKDFIIVGSGPGGATAAKELSQRKIQSTFFQGNPPI